MQHGAVRLPVCTVPTHFPVTQPVNTRSDTAYIPRQCVLEAGSLFAAHGNDPHVHTAVGVVPGKDFERGVVDVDEAVVERNSDLQAVGRAMIDVVLFVSHSEVDWEAPRVLDRLGGYEL